jgi:hypothetical protein
MRIYFNDDPITIPGIDFKKIKERNIIRKKTISRTFYSNDDWEKQIEKLKNKNKGLKYILESNSNSITFLIPSKEYYVELNTLDDIDKFLAEIKIPAKVEIYYDYEEEKINGHLVLSIYT